MTAFEEELDAQKGSTRDGGNSDDKVTILNILIQGIKSKDKNMLENALSYNSMETIKASLEKLGDPFCLELFEEVLNRIEEKPMKLLDLSNWISALLVKISKMMNTLNCDVNNTKLILNQMERLNEIITMRLSYNKDLIHLQAILDIYRHIFDEDKTITEMCKKLSSDSDNALITYQFENEAVCDEEEYDHDLHEERSQSEGGLENETGTDTDDSY